MEEESRKIIYFKDLVRIVQKRKWLAISFFLLLTFTGTVRTMMLQSVYRTTAKLQIEASSPHIVDIKEVFDISLEWDYKNTQVGIIRSRSLAREVIIQLKLWENPEVANREAPNIIVRIIVSIRNSIAQTIGDIKEYFFSLVRRVLKPDLPVPKEIAKKVKEPRKKNDSVPDAATMSQLIDSYLDGLTVEDVEQTRLIDISYEGRYPQRITEIINTHTRAYIEQNLKMKYEANKIAMEWLSKGLEELRVNGEKAEIALQRFREKEDIVSLDSIMFSSKNAEQENIIVQKISQLNSSLTTAKMKRIELGAVYEQLQKVIDNPEEIEAFPEIIQNPTFRALKDDYNRLVRQYSELSEKYGEKHPKIVSLRAELEEQKKRIKIEIKNLSKSIENEYLTAKETEEKLEKALNEFKQEAMLMNRKAVEYAILKKDLQSNQELYETLQKRLKETSLPSAIEASNIYIVDPAEIPLWPVRPKRKMLVLLSAILGLTVGVGLTLLFEFLDNTIKSPYDLDIYLRRLPLLGPVGSFSTLESELITLVNPESNFSESFRNIRTNLNLRCIENCHQTFLITSPDRGEGKTLVSANLSVTMTQNRQKVLLIDANLRMPRLYSLFGVENAPGLSDLLKGETILEKVIKPTEVEGVSIITAGKIPIDPLELLSSESMISIMEKMRQRFDFVIIDSPGISVGPDATVISRLADGVIMVTQFAKTPRTLAQQAIAQLSNVQAKLSGVVINNIDYKRGRYHFPYYGGLLKDDSRIDMYMVEK